MPDIYANGSHREAISVGASKHDYLLRDLERPKDL
jgi:hypothetical protein